MRTATAAAAPKDQLEEVIVTGFRASLQSALDKKRASGITSKVERVVMHIRVTTIVLDEKGAWDDVTSALLLPQAPSPKPKR